MTPPASASLPASTPATLPTAAIPLRPRGSNHVGMRAFNERVVLQAIRLQGSCPKAELARLTGLTAQTVGLITTRLEEDGLLIRHEPVRGRIGQPSVPLALNPDGAFSLGLKIGRRSADWLLVDFTGQVRQRLSLEYAFPHTDTLFPAIERNVAQLRDSLGPLGERLVGVGVAAPMQLGGWHRILGLSPTESEQWNQIDLRAQVQALTNAPVLHAKDTVAACVAELVQGRGRDLKNFLYLFVDTFVGGGLVLNSLPHMGKQGNAAAVASLPTALASAGATPEQLVRYASLWELEQRLRALGADPQAAYDERALQPPLQAELHAWLEQAAHALAHCVINGTAFLDIDAVVIDGSFSRAVLALLIERTHQALQHYQWEGLWRPAIVAGTTGADASALGGALLPLHANFAPDHDLFLKSVA
ncbi:MAG: ROK family transcriptional regulator [Rhodoferax sp.]